MTPNEEFTSPITSEVQRPSPPSLAGQFNAPLVFNQIGSAFIQASSNGTLGRSILFAPNTLFETLSAIIASISAGLTTVYLKQSHGFHKAQSRSIASKASSNSRSTV